MVDLLNRFPCLLHSLPLSIHPTHSIPINFSNSHYLKKKTLSQKIVSEFPYLQKLQPGSQGASLAPAQAG